MHQNRHFDSENLESLPNLTFCGTASTKRKSSNFDYQMIYRFLLLFSILFFRSRSVLFLSTIYIHMYIHYIPTYIYRLKHIQSKKKVYIIIFLFHALTKQKKKSTVVFTSK